MRSFAIVILAVASLTTLRPVDAVEGPSTKPVPAGAYTIDKAHTSVVFKVSHLGFSMFTGRFAHCDATLSFDPRRLAASRVEVTIDPRSIGSDNAPDGFLAELAGDKFLDAARFPQMRFVSQRIEDAGGGRFRIHGALTLHGVTRPLTLDARYNGGYAGHPFDPHARVGFSAQGSLRRSEFGIGYGIPAPGSTFGVADEVQIQIETEFSGP